MEEKNEEIKIFQKKNEIRKHNSLIRCDNKLTALQRKSFNILIKNSIEQIKEDGLKRYYTLNLAEYKENIGYSKNDKNNVDIRDSIKELVNKSLEWNLDKFGNGTVAPMLGGFEIKNGILTWSLSPFLEDKILKDGFTILKLKILTSLDSTYSIALYELLQQWKKRKWVKFELKEFKKLMGIKEEQYKRMELFKRKVLLIAINEINEKTDLKVYYDDIKMGTKITDFKFTFNVLSINEIRERDKKLKELENYIKIYGVNIGKKYNIDGWHTLTKYGLKYRGKINMNFIESVDYILKLKEEKLLKEEDIKDKKDIIV